MARSRVSRFPQRFNTKVRRPSWSIGPNGTLQLTATGSAVFGTGAVAADVELTIIRTRGIFQAFLSQATASLDGFQGAVGICKVSSNAFGVGITAIPTPVTDIAWDGWLWYQRFNVKAATATLGVVEQMAGIEYVVDAKAMRKTNVTDVIVGVIEATEVGTAIGNFRLDTRMLSKSMR